MKYKKTNILCFKCLKRYGIDCPGRKSNESTLCHWCGTKRIWSWKVQQWWHLIKWYLGFAK